MSLYINNFFIKFKNPGDFKEKEIFHSRLSLRVKVKFGMTTKQVKCQPFMIPASLHIYSHNKFSHTTYDRTHRISN